MHLCFSFQQISQTYSALPVVNSPFLQISSVVNSKPIRKTPTPYVFEISQTYEMVNLQGGK